MRPRLCGGLKGDNVPQPVTRWMPRSTSPPHEMVLVVDDDPALLSALKFSLEVEGFAVRVFLSGEDLLDGPVPEAACLVIDYRLPAMDGLALVAELRLRRVNAPAILMTTNPTSAVQRQAIIAGLAIVEKPLLGNALAEAIRQAIGPPLIRRAAG